MTSDRVEDVLWRVQGLRDVQDPEDTPFKSKYEAIHLLVQAQAHPADSFRQPSCRSSARTN